MRHERRRTTTTAVMLAMIAAMVMTACTSSLSREWAASREALTAAQQTMLIMHDHGLMSNEDILNAAPYVAAAQDALDQVEPWVRPNRGDIDPDHREQARRMIQIATVALTKIDEIIVERQNE